MSKATTELVAKFQTIADRIILDKDILVFNHYDPEITEKDYFNFYNGMTGLFEGRYFDLILYTAKDGNKAIRLQYGTKGKKKLADKIRSFGFREQIWSQFQKTELRLGRKVTSECKI